VPPPMLTERLPSSLSTPFFLRLSGGMLLVSAGLTMVHVAHLNRGL